MKLPAITRPLLLLWALEECVSVGFAVPLTILAHGTWLTAVGIWVAIDWGPLGAVLGLAIPVPLAIRLVAIVLGLVLFAGVALYRYRAKRAAAIRAAEAAEAAVVVDYGWRPGPVDYPVEAPGPLGYDVSRAYVGARRLAPPHPADVPPSTPDPDDPPAIVPW